ncbi:MAG: hypothetical protein EBS23_04145 [Betaproteobacteria bacterium]|nr:hypothetical protein [Betaproteobacteria bacterium]
MQCSSFHANSVGQHRMKLLRADGHAVTQEQRGRPLVTSRYSLPEVLLAPIDAHAILELAARVGMRLLGTNLRLIWL